MKPQKSLACLLLFSVLAAAQSHPHKKTAKGGAASKPKTDTAQSIHQSALIIDTHADTPQRFLDENFDLGKNRQGNLGAEFFSIWVEPEFKGRYARRAMELIDSVYQQAARHTDKMTMAFTADEIVRAHEQ